MEILSEWSWIHFDVTADAQYKTPTDRTSPHLRAIASEEKLRRIYRRPEHVWHGLRLKGVSISSEIRTAGKCGKSPRFETPEKLILRHRPSSLTIHVSGNIPQHIPC
jgi:hypothetical protein